MTHTSSAETISQFVNNLRVRVLVTIILSKTEKLDSMFETSKVQHFQCEDFLLFLFYIFVN